MAEPYLAQIMPFAGNFAIRGWAFCEGQLLPISQYTAVFSLLGTTFGGDGRTTFGLPDLRGRMIVGPGNGPGLPSYSWGQKGGRNNVTLTVANMPSHNHAATLKAERVPGSVSAASGNMLAGGTNIYAPTAPQEDVNMSADAISVNNTGGSQQFDITNPYVAIYYEIALQGIFPSRN